MGQQPAGHSINTHHTCSKLKVGDSMSNTLLVDLRLPNSQLSDYQNHQNYHTLPKRRERE